MSFIRLNIIVEGQTEERFVKDTLAPYLSKFQVYATARCVVTSRYKNRKYKGGLTTYAKVKSDINKWLREEKAKEVRFTTMFDLYALPNDFPSYKEAQKIQDPYQKIAFLENAMQKDIADKRFIAYMQLHEFEALVLANPSNLAMEYFDAQEAIKKLENQLSHYNGNAELINEKRETAPSKRILKLIPAYDKVSIGAALVDIVGISTLKEQCQHFKEWIEKLEALAP